MTVSLIIPFASEDIRRLQIFDWVEMRWEDTCPGFEMCIGHDDPHDFNRSKARNKAFEESSGDIIVISDADTACPIDNVLGGIKAVEEGAPWVIAHTEYHSLTEEYTDWLITQPPGMMFKPPFESNWVMRNRSVAGVLVMRREDYERAGGYDERFEGWSYEDNAFQLAMDSRVGRHCRVFGPVLHLWHDPGPTFDDPNVPRNREILSEYENL